MRHFIVLFLILVVTPIIVVGQNLVPPIENYKIFEYKAASKNWDLAVSPEGELFVANNKGLLHFNGEHWAFYQLPKKTTIRSVAWVQGKVYTGSYEEFGYWEMNVFGDLEYTSLSHLIQGHEFTSEEFWQILTIDNAIVFRSFSGIYVFKNEHITIIEPRIVVNHMAVWEGNILVAGGKNGLSYLQGKDLVPISGTSILNSKIVVDMEPVNNGMLIGTKLHGVYFLRNGLLQPINEDINFELKQHQLNQILPLTNGQVAFGTIKNGIYFYNLRDKDYYSVNREVGLQNNTVLSLEQFNDQLWIGLDNGIDRLQLDNPLTYYTDYTGTVGTVYDVAQYDGTLYLGSNTGIHYFEGNTLRFVEGSQGHVWDLEVLDGKLFCGHNTGTFILENGTLNLISDISGGYQMAKIPSYGATYLQGTYTGLARYLKDEHGSWSVKAIEGITFPIKYLCFENPSTLWVAHPYKGLYRLLLNEEYSKVVEIQEFADESIPNIYNVKLFSIKNQIVIYSDGIWYKYDPIRNKIIVFEEFQDFNYKELVHFNKDYYWFRDHQGVKELIVTNLNDDKFVLEDAQLGRRLVPEAENVIKINDSIYYFTLSDGIGKLNLANFRSQLGKFQLSIPKLVFFKDQDGTYALDGTPIVIENKRSREIEMEFAATNMVQPKYFYNLKGPMELSSFMDTGIMKFQNLPYGAYSLEIFTVGINNARSQPRSVAFQIMPPWYLSSLSYVVYGLIGLTIIFLVRGYNSRKLKRKHTLLKEKLEREQEEQLALLEKKKLAKEIKVKQKELTSTTLSMARKNELILELKNLLLMNKSKFDNQQRYRSFMKKLNSAISDDEDWRHFEVNFKELHDDFFETLLLRYPALTSKDLKLCAYLKMNLTSKEIAPLMGISTRGVEIHRYRLRKKLDLDSDDNISNFLITLK
ncbi:LuxR C-terminal-related transcriptional regulator [Arenibacter sp. F20364]|uniref:helix-turn-helix and ligand-binding sensor domain-containing protein n=1 Tax=Arenibacter sp. F20364 TaxID=2926415 RepID=UPI001FF4DD63|nr:LuxR C-terminal-related transcriptional regulator [Arenibacter sp. F20364]MCK0192599.1 LuxR C-terminal-related transcriptional regulator [Arenibacter sp. F20364]